MAKDNIARFGVSPNMEVLVLRGRASVVRSVAEHLIAVRVVKHGKLKLTTTGKDIPV
jgi:CopG family nickel-responsive transcriptional regulator